MGRRMMIGGGNLPPQFERLKFIESTGTQWINLGVRSEGIVICDFKYEFPTITQYMCLCGVLGDANSDEGILRLIPYHSSFNAGLLYIEASAKEIFDSVAIRNIPYEIDKTYRVRVYKNHEEEIVYKIIYSNGSIEEYRTISAVQPIIGYNKHDIFLFAYNNNGNGAARMSRFRLDFIIFQDSRYSILSRFLAVYNKETNKAGVYNTANGEFRTNSGSGKWICHRMDGTTFLAD